MVIIRVGRLLCISCVVIAACNSSPTTGSATGSDGRLPGTVVSMSHPADLAPNTENATRLVSTSLTPLGDSGGPTEKSSFTTSIWRS